jgi:Glycosyl transferases group 1
LEPEDSARSGRRVPRSKPSALANRRAGGYAGSGARPQYDANDAVIKSLNGKLMLPLTLGTARARRLPFVLWTGMWAHPRTALHRLSRPLTDATYRGSDAIVVYGEHVRRFVLETPGVDGRKVFVAGQAVDPQRFSVVQPVRNGNGVQILDVGQFEERKGLRSMLDAAASLADVGLCVRLIVNGSQESEIRARAATMGNVEVAGYLPQQELPDELGRSRCHVLPSITTALDKEPWGLVINEAMHAGPPVITTDAVGSAAVASFAMARTASSFPNATPLRLRKRSAGLRRTLTSLRGWGSTLAKTPPRSRTSGWRTRSRRQWSTR